MKKELSNSKQKKNSMIHVLWSMSKNGGFAMLFSVLVSSLVLSVGLSIFTLTLKELVLSSAGRESQFAFYAADTGAECALYWDFEGTDVFATSSDSVGPSSSPLCNTQDILSGAAIDSDSDSASTQFTFDLRPATSYCVTVTVTKETDNNILRTTVDSRGYNTCDTADQTRVERALRVTY